MTEQYYHITGDEIRLVEIPPKKNLSEKLDPTKVHSFVVEENMMTGKKPKLQFLPPFFVPEKTYGDLDKHANHFVALYGKKREKFSVLLVGESGTGKSLLAKRTAQLFAEKYGMATVIVTKDHIEDLALCLSMLNSPALILIDEFEKMFEETTDQDFLLSILDGLYEHNHVFILTANDENKVNEYMYNRPKRIRYVINYNRLSWKAINEVLEDRLEDKSKLIEIKMIIMQLSKLNFDALSSLIDEINLFPELSPQEIANHLNLTSGDNAQFYRFHVDFGDDEANDFLVIRAREQVLLEQVFSSEKTPYLICQPNGRSDQASLYINLADPKYNFADDGLHIVANIDTEKGYSYSSPAFEKMHDEIQALVKDSVKHTKKTKTSGGKWYDENLVIQCALTDDYLREKMPIYGQEFKQFIREDEITQASLELMYAEMLRNKLAGQEVRIHIQDVLNEKAR